MDCLKITSDGKLTCVCCQKEFASLSALMFHIKLEHSENDVIEAVKNNSSQQSYAPAKSLSPQFI